MTILIVAEEAMVLPEPLLENCPRLEYYFSDDYLSDGFSGWERETQPGLTRIEVASYCRNFDGGFRLQALNRFLAQAIIREKPVAILVCGLWGCTVDLPRIAHMLGVPTILLTLGWDKAVDLCDSGVQAWLVDALQCCSHIVGDLPEFIETEGSAGLLDGRVIARSELASAISELQRSKPARDPFSYSTYEFVMRDHPLLFNMQQPETVHFSGLESVLDVGCGAGIFLDCLRREGIRGVGVERDFVISNYGRGMGLDILTEDALGFLESTVEQFDGIYCSHFVEHLKIDVVERLLTSLYARVRSGGVVLLIFPDPESIRSQLLGFWRDPEHVRFYHSELIESIAMSAGFEVEWSSYDEQPHNVIPFELEPIAMPSLPRLEPPELVEPALGWLGNVMAKLGWKSAHSVARTQRQWSEWAASVCSGFAQQRLYLEKLEERSDTLWRVNQTWAWNDNVTIRLRKTVR